jgi:hypothetical protein
MLLIGMASFAQALPPVPEIDPSSGASAFILLAGTLMIMRARRK